MRITKNINKKWKFRKGTEDISPAQDDDWQTVHLPHTWNNWDGQDGGNDYFRGKGVYTKYIVRPDVPADYRIFAEFEGVNSVAEIFLNGTKAAEHRGGYSTFRVEVTEAMRQGNMTLSVIADNSNRFDVYPQAADFTLYGGIYRDVNLIAVPGTHFCLDFYGSPGIAFDSKIGGSSASVFLAAWVTDPEWSDLVQFVISDEDERIVSEITTPAKELTTATISIPRPHLWQGMEDPYLYTVTARILRGNECVDEIAAALGIREFTVDPEKGFCLNGVPTPLRGVSRHHDKFGIGSALTAEDHWEDAQMIAELGANTVRLPHYQHSQAFYEACDAYGLVVWTEIPFISVMNEDPKAHTNCREQLKELIYQNYNHPSICFWGLANEITIGGELPALLDNLRDLHRLAKELDPARPTVMAQVSMLPKDSPYNQVTDLLCYNHYFGWYSGDYSHFEECLNEFHQAYPDKPFGISEYGCEGIVNWHSDTPRCRDYTEEYQAQYHEHLAKIIHEHPYLWATYIWSLFDFGSDSKNDGGIRGRSSTGLVTFDRKIKKDAFYIYKAYWSQEPFVYITGRRYALRPGTNMDVKVYSNQKRVTLFVNGVEYATLDGDKVFIFEHVPLSRDGVCVTAYAANGCEDTVRFRHTDSQRAEYRMPAEKEEI